jgi:hypothetical protein
LKKKEVMLGFDDLNFKSFSNELLAFKKHVDFWEFAEKW